MSDDIDVDDDERPGVLHYYSSGPSFDYRDVSAPSCDYRDVGGGCGSQGRILTHNTSFNPCDLDDTDALAPRDISGGGWCHDASPSCRVTMETNMPHDESYPVISDDEDDDDEVRKPLLPRSNPKEMVRITNVSAASYCWLLISTLFLKP